MKIIADKKTLVTAFARIQGITEKSSLNPITMYALVNAQDNNLIVAATNLQIGTKATYPASTITQEGKILVQARKIYEIIKEMPEGPIGLEEKENYILEITSGKKIKFKLSGSSPNDFPMLFKEKENSFVPFNKKQFLKMIDLTFFSMSREESTLNIHGAYLENIEGGITRMVTTDGFRLSVVDETFEQILPFSEGILIPYKGIVELQKILHEKKEEKNIYIFADEKMLFTRIGEIEFNISLIEKKFPDYRVIIPGDGYKKFETILPRDEILPALRRISIVSQENNRPVLFSFKEKRLEISSEDSDAGMNVHETLPVNYDKKEEIVFCLNGSYLLDILLAVNDDICIEYNTEEENKPLILRPQNKKEQVKYIVMPMLKD